MSGAGKVSACLALAWALWGHAAHAQQWVLGASAEVASGVAGGGPENPVIERARTRLRIGVDLRVDEFPKDIYAVAILAEVEPHSSFGIDFRYMRRLSPKIDVNVGVMGFIFPESLVGPACGVRYHLALSKTIDLLVGPEIDLLVIGTDVPSDSIVWEGLLQVGVHLDL